MKLRDYKLSDAISLQKNADNPKVSAYLRELLPSPYTEKDAEWWVSEGCMLGEGKNFAIGLFCFTRQLALLVSHAQFDEC